MSTSRRPPEETNRALDESELLRRLNWTPYSDADGAPAVYPRQWLYWIDVEDRVTARLEHGNPPRLEVTHVRHDDLMRLEQGDNLQVGRLVPYTAQVQPVRASLESPEQVAGVYVALILNEATTVGELRQLERYLDWSIA